MKKFIEKLENWFNVIETSKVNDVTDLCREFTDIIIGMFPENETIKITNTVVSSNSVLNILLGSELKDSKKKEEIISELMNVMKYSVDRIAVGLNYLEELHNSELKYTDKVAFPEYAIYVISRICGDFSILANYHEMYVFSK